MRQETSPKEFIQMLLVVALILGAFAFVGTLDHEQEVAHEQWMAQLEESGVWVIR